MPAVTAQDVRVQPLPWVVRSEVGFSADPKRVLARLFVPGQELLKFQQSRATGVLARILALPEEIVHTELVAVQARYSGRHRDLPGLLVRHYDQISHRIPRGASLSADRRNLLGAWFTHEFAVEAAALFNPSMVPHPDQSLVPAGHLRFLMSLRAVGEGHLSSIEFRTGTLGPDDELVIDDPGPHVETGTVTPATYDRALFAAKLTEDGADAESASYLIGRLPFRFTGDELERALSALTGQSVTRQGGRRTDELARRIAACSYHVEFAPLSAIAERVLWPHAPSESNGIEDARFVRFVADDGVATYRATYTAFDGAQVAPQLIETADFRSFEISQLAGPAAKNKGIALFPRTVGSSHFALSRWDRENISLAASDDGQWWDHAGPLHTPGAAWELIQTGNCGSPLETEAGWLVLTHGVGPMREYAIGAMLLDLDEPDRVIGELGGPLISAAEDERDGYVPNVVYSCGGMVHGDRLLLPYGVSDSAVRFAFVDLPALLDRLTGAGAITSRRIAPAC